MIKIICEMCGVEAYRRPRDISRNKHNFCCHPCYGKWLSLHKPPQHKITHKCIVCNKEFSRYPSQMKRHSTAGKYCSIKCRDINRKGVSTKIVDPVKESERRKKISNKHRGKTLTLEHRKKLSENHADFKGEKSPNWKGGISFEPYCNKFSRPFKERVRSFYSRVCVECGTTEKENGKRLHVHHVNYDKSSCCSDIKPLFVALCSKCHGRTGANRMFWENRFTEIIMTQFNGECYMKIPNTTNSYSDAP